jgi:hypothetical protein
MVNRAYGTRIAVLRDAKKRGRLGQLHISREDLARLQAMCAKLNAAVEFAWGDRAAAMADNAGMSPSSARSHLVRRTKFANALRAMRREGLAPKLAVDVPVINRAVGESLTRAQSDNVVAAIGRRYFPAFQKALAALTGNAVNLEEPIVRPTFVKDSGYVKMRRLDGTEVTIGREPGMIAKAKRNPIKTGLVVGVGGAGAAILAKRKLAKAFESKKVARC